MHGVARDADEIERERQRWRSMPRERPRDIVRPGSGQESVWDYPRPPRVEPERRRLCVEFGGVVIAESSRGLRVLETSGPPVFYLPPADIRMELLEASNETVVCEWKGTSSYWTLRVADRVAENAAWSYATPEPAFEAIRDHLAFFAGRVDACSVGDARVVPQPGDYYGGWITPEITGPFKGEPGSERW